MRESLDQGSGAPVVNLSQFEPQWVYTMLEALYGEPVEASARPGGRPSLRCPRSCSAPRQHHALSQRCVPPPAAP
jgi:hypothetical protein